MSELKHIERSFDFQNPPQDPIVVGNRSIKPEVKRNLLGIKKRPKFLFYKLFIKNLEVPDSIIIDDPAKLIYLELYAQPKSSKEKTNYKTNDIQEFMVTEAEMPYKIYLDPRQIKDYTNFDDASALISFELCSQSKKNESIAVAQRYTIQLSFAKAHSVPNIQFFLHPAFTRKFEYAKQERISFGELQVTTRADRYYADELETCLISIWMSNFDGLVYVTDEIREISESNPSIKGGGLREEGDSVKSDLRIDTNDGKLSLKNLRANNTVTIPVYIDLDKYTNPTEKVDEQIIANVKYTKREIPYEESDAKTITILPDSTETRLLKKIIWLNQEIELTEDDFHLDHAVQWIPNEKNAAMGCFIFRLGNIAENNQGVVQIKKLSLKFTSENSVTLNKQQMSKFPNTSSNDLNNLFVVRTEIDGEYFSLKELPELLEFPNAPASFYDLSVAFRHQDILALGDEMATISCTISFEYQQNNGALEEEEFMIFSSAVVFNLEKNPGRYWLALDFGTSASVAAFDDGSQLQNQKYIDNILLNLQEPLRKHIVTELDSADAYSDDQIEEYGTKFISSKCLLQQKKQFGLVPYTESVVRLSPSINQAKTYWSNVIPFLKSLIGMQYLPNFDGHFSDFKYYTEDGRKEKQFKDEPLEVNNILKIAYYSLLCHFAEQTEQVMDNKAELNKLILTIPNAFSPKHVQLIRNVFDDPSSGLSHFRKNYLTFLCESDAVSLQYEMLWNNYNNLRPDKDKYRVGDEYVLIYDMGAGTLDLTYIKISRDGTGGKEISVIGRLGKTTAGNYVDYELAQILHDLMQEQMDYDDPDFAQLFTNPGLDQMSMAIALKGVIRDKIKPNLGIQGNFDMEGAMLGEAQGIENPFQEIYVEYSNITNHQLYKSLLASNTTEVFDHFFDLYRMIDGQEYTKGEIPLDTVILSGRGVQLHGLREEIINNLKVWSGNENLYCPTDLPADQLKSAVVQGAIQYALLYRDQRTSSVKISNRNLQARYGLLYIDPATSLWEFKELLNPSVRPVSQEPIRRDGITIYRYDSDIYNADPGNSKRQNFVNLSATAVAWFVQSFSYRTADDYNKGTTDYITKMVSFDPGSLGADRSNVPVRIRITGNNEMEFYFGSGKIDQQNPLRVDLDESASFRKSMWPYLSVK